MTEIFLVRHAKSLGNTRKIFQGCRDLDLSPDGEEQLSKLAERFRKIHLDAVFSSPQKRAVKTAQAVALYHEAQVEIVPRLHEIFAGKWELLPYQQISELYPYEWQLWNSGSADFCAPEGESLKDVYARMSEAVGRVALNNDGKTVAVVSHGCALRCYFCYALGLQLEKIGEVVLPGNASVSRVLYENGKAAVDFLNDETHLQA